jgi:hypothetical protein
MTGGAIRDQPTSASTAAWQGFIAATRTDRAHRAPRRERAHVRRVLCARCAVGGGIERKAQRSALRRRRYQSTLVAAGELLESPQSWATKPDNGPTAGTSVGVELVWRSCCAGFYAGSAAKRKRLRRARRLAVIVTLSQSAQRNQREILAEGGGSRTLRQQY